jgi:hypothetical protein
MALIALCMLSGCGGSSSSGCGPNPCNGACPSGCTDATVCQGGAWKCLCACGDASSPADLSVADLSGADLSSTGGDLSGGDLSGADLAMCTSAIQPPATWGDGQAIRYDCQSDADCAWIAEGCFDFCVNANEPSHFDPCQAACNPSYPPCTCVKGTCSACYATGPFCGM